MVGLVSGGKDSCHNLVQCVAAGHEVVALANLRPRQTVQETDSQMFQTVGWDNVAVLAEAMGLPLYVEQTDMEAREEGRDYRPREGDEVEDLLRLLARVQEQEGVQGVSVGAILSDYQRVRVESVCLRLGLTPLAFLWRRDQEELLQEMVDTGVEAVLVKVACLGLDRKHLGLTLAECQAHLGKLARQYGVNVCGEGGEFETFTLHCPLFRRRLKVTGSSVVTHSQSDIAPVLLLVLQLQLEEEARPGSQRDLLGEELVRRLSPDSQAGELGVLGNSEAAPEVEVGRLELVGEEEDFMEEEEDWFSVRGVVGSGEDAGEATRNAFIILQSLLKKEDLALEMVVKVYLYVDSMDNYHAINQAYVAHFGLNPPVRVCVGAGASHLPPGARLVLAAVGQAGGRGRVLHVQGISHWAPANIGPYSQGVVCGDQLHVSGQIGLVPGSMVLAKTEAAQAALGLRHTLRVAAAMVPGLGWGEVRSAVCYVVGREGARQAERRWREVGGTAEVTYREVAELPRGAAVEWEVVFQITLPPEEES